MDLGNFRLPLLLLATLGCCDCSPLVSEKTNGVVGKNVTFLTTITSTSNFLTITWNFDNGAEIVPILTSIPSSGTVNIDDRYASRIDYNTATCALELRRLVKEDQGHYALTTVTNTGVQQSGHIRLEVLETISDVRIAFSPAEAVEFNSTVVLTCTAKGSYSYKWLNGTTPVVADGTHLKLNGNVLTISEVWRTDLRGPIYCVAENALESGRSPPFNLTVSYGPEQILMTQKPAETFLKKGSNITFTCSARSDPPALLQWMFNGAQLNQLPNMTISSLEEKNSGNYTCVAYNPKTLRVIASQVATISVVEPISGTNVSSSSSPLIAGSSIVNLTCKATAGKAETVEWTKDGKPVIPDSHIILSADKMILTIIKVAKTDAGDYKCQLTNKVNKDEGSYKMVISYGPENVKITGKNTVKFDNSVEISCSADSVPLSSYTWSLNGTVLNISQEKYQIEKASLKDSGTYTCEVHNPITRLTANATHRLTVSELDAVDNGLSSGAIAGIVIGVLVALIIIACIVCRRKKSSTDIPSPY